jgi:hypothetical protein
VKENQGGVRPASGKAVGRSSVANLALRPLAERASLERVQLRRISVLRCGFRHQIRVYQSDRLSGRGRSPRRTTPWFSADNEAGS